MIETCVGGIGRRHQTECPVTALIVTLPELRRTYCDSATQNPSELPLGQASMLIEIAAKGTYESTLAFLTGMTVWGFSAVTPGPLRASHQFTYAASTHHDIRKYNENISPADASSGQCRYCS